MVADDEGPVSERYQMHQKKLADLKRKRIEPGGGDSSDEGEEVGGLR